MDFKRFLISIVLIFMTLVSIQNAVADSKQLTIAVLDFKNNSPVASDELKPMEQGIADMMITTLSQVHAFKIVERSQLNAMMEEMALGQAGVLDESTAQQVGQIVGAHYLVLGSFMKGFKDDIRIDCRIVRTETAVTLKAEEVSGELEDILELMNKLGQKVIKNLDVKLNSREKNAIDQLKTDCSYNVLKDYFLALDLIEKKQYRKADQLLGKVIDECPKFRRAKYVRREMRTHVKKMLQRKKAKVK